MKRRFTFLLAAVLLLMSGLSWGQTRTQINWVASEQGYSNAQAIESVDFDDNVTAAFNKGTNNNGPKYYTSGTAIRCYGGNYFTIETSVGNLTEIVLTFGSSDGTNAITTDVGTYVSGSWSGSATSVTFTIGGTNGNRRIAGISITYSTGGQQTVATPTFSPAAGTYYEAQNVTINCTTEGATIYYTLDGNNPTTSSVVYSSPIAISQTTTVKAMAAKAGMNNSSVATATYTIEEAPSVITIAAARALALNEYALVQGVVTFIDGRNIYVQDETAGIDLYLNNNTVPSGLALGDKVQAYGKKAVFNGLIELSGINGSVADQFSVISSGNELPLAVKTIAEILADHQSGDALQSTRVQIVNATIGTINTSNNTPLTQGENTLNIYKVPALDNITAGNAVDVIGVIGCYNNPQLRVALASDVTIHETPMETVATPTFSPVGGTYSEAQNVTIACTTQGASIYYTIDGTDPVVEATGTNGTLYSTALAISENTTVKAIAVKEGMINSEIATAEYTIEVPTPPAVETAFTLIKHNNALIAGDKYIVVGIKGEGYKALGKQATNNRVAVDVTPADNVITLTPATANEDGVFELTLGQADGNWTFYDSVNGGYLYAASSSANYLKVQAENDANGQWTIAIDTNGVATIKAQGSNTRNWLRLNNNGTPFACYASGQLDVYLYKAGDVPTPPTPSYYTVSVAPGISGGTISVDPTSALEGATITVTAEATQGYELTTLTYTYNQTTTNIDMETMQFVMPAADVVVNGTFTELASVATPTMSLAAGTYIQAKEVSIACTTEGATIYYTLDGTDPTTESAVYSSAITLSETTTVKAMAAKEGMNNSAVASATYTFPSVISIAEARGLAANQYGLVQGVVTFIDGRNVYVQDETAGVDLYLNSNTVPEALAIGDKVLAYGKKTTYNGLVELTGINGSDANQFVIISNGNELPVAVATVADILADFAGANMLQSTRVQIVDATLGAINNNNNTPITQDGSTMNIYKMPVVDGLEEGDIVTVVGVLGCYNAPQLRVLSADDVEYTHPTSILLNPASLAGFNYVYGQGPSQVKSFVITGRSLNASTKIYPSENFEISSYPSDVFIPEGTISINTLSGNYSFTIKVRLKEGLEVGAYEESIMIYEEELDTLYVALSGSVTEQSQTGGSYVRVGDLSQVGNGAKVIFAARYNENADEYYAMTAQASGKPEGVLFNSVVGANEETLPSSITDNESTFAWDVTTDGTNYTFTNADGNVLGYTSSTNFATGGDNTGWTIVSATSEATAMVPEYTAFVIANANVTNRAFALNSNHNFGPYHTQNLAADNYNFFIDIFAIAGSGTMVCATPTFSPEGGTYYEEQVVTISCSTPDATIYYTLDGSDPTANSEVYSNPITIAENTTVKAIAMKEGYEDSGIAEAQYVIILDAVVVFNQDWEGEMNGWTFVTVEGNKPWTIGQYSGNHYAYGNGYNGGANVQWCISPAFNLYMYNNTSLTFRNAKNYTGPDLELFFSNDYDGSDPTTATWTELEFEKSTGSFAWVESGTIDLAGFTGENCYIGFKYTSTETEAAAWEVDDITLVGFTTMSYLNVTPTALNGFTYIVGNGPSAAQTFTVSGGNLPPAPGGNSGGVGITCNNSHYEFSLDGEEYWPNLVIPVVGTLEPTTVYVRLEAGLYVGMWNGVVTLEDGGTTATVNLSGSVTEEPTPGGDWVRINSINELINGGQVIIASRYDATVGDGYYAMTAEVSGKPDGVLFTSVNDNGLETLPAEIADNAETYLWNVVVNDTVITLTNAAGDALGYSSSTNFAGNTNIEWNVAYGTAGDNAMVPGYTGFMITNGTTTNRGIAKNASNKFGAYAISNSNNPDYNFYLDLFVLGGTATQTVATPVFSMASGTYYEEIDVEITCATEGAAIYYTLDGSDPTASSTLYTEAIHVAEDVTIKAIGILEGYEDSNIATVNYVINTGLTILFNQDWEGEMDGWTFVTVEGNKPWVIATYAGNKYANANGYGDDVDNEQWCISPEFNLNNYANQNVILTFRNAMKFEGPALELFFSNDYDGQDPTTATWQPMTFTQSPGNYTWTESGEISLNAFSGAICNIAFKYTSTIADGAAAWEVDDIMLAVDMGNDPYLTVTPNALTGFQHYLNAGPSAAQTFVVAGGNLPLLQGMSVGGVTISCNNSHFELSDNGVDYYPYLGLMHNGTLEPTTVYVRLNGDAIGTYEGTITVENDIVAHVTVSGEVLDDTNVGESLAESVEVWNRTHEILVDNHSGDDLEMVVYNLLGQPVMSNRIATGSNRVAHNLSEGLYLVTLRNTQGMMTVKIIVR